MSGGGINVDESILDPSSSPGSPTFSNKKVVEFDETDITLTSSFQTLYTYTGSGKFVGAVFVFNDKNPEVKLTIDGNTVFSLTLNQIDDVQIKTNSAGEFTGTGGGLFVDGSSLMYKPSFPVSYDTSVLFEGLDSGGKKLMRKIVTLTKET